MRGSIATVAVLVISLAALVACDGSPTESPPEADGGTPTYSYSAPGLSAPDPTPPTLSDSSPQGDDAVSRTPEYLTEIVPTCSPIEGTDLDPCGSGDTVAAFGPTGTVAGVGPTSGGFRPVSIQSYLNGTSLIAVPHIVARGTFVPGSVRCTVGNIYRDAAYVGLAEGGRDLKCFADLQAREYILGRGPSRLPVEVHHFHYGLPAAASVYGDATGDETPTGQEAEEWLRRGFEKIVRDRDGFFTKEMVHFLAPGYDQGMVTWKVWSTWGVERTDDDAIIAVHPHRTSYRLSWPEGYQQYQSSLEVPLATFKSNVQSADQARRTENGGRIVPSDYRELPDGVAAPSLLQDANRIDQFFRSTGAYDHPDGPPKLPPPACGLGAVSDPLNDGWLMQACITLLEANDALRGNASLNWSVERAMADWDGVALGTGDNPVYDLPSLQQEGSIVESLSLSNKSLSGVIPEELGSLYGLERLKLDNNNLTGAIPKALEDLADLTELRLSGNSFTGCIPLTLRSVPTNDLSSLNIPYCQPPAPANLRVGTATETGVPLNWDAVADTAKYRVEYRVSPAKGTTPEVWAVDDDTLTGTSHTVDELICGNTHQFRVSAYGDGTVYAAEWSEPSAIIVATTAEWSEPSAIIVATTAECAPPVFDASRYTFEVGEDAEVGTLVGSVAATDSPGDAVTYSITEGNNDGVFSIDEATGEITVASALDYAAAPVYLLTIEAGDEHGNAATVSAQVSVTSVCLNGTVVPNSDRNSALVGDCVILYGIRKELAGTAALDWSADTAIADWQGVRVRGTPNLSNVTHLYLSGNQLSGRIPSQLAGLANLEVIHLHDNQLTGPIPSALGGLSRLRQLTLEGNRLSGAIPPALGGLASLTDLQLADNRLSGAIPAELGDLDSLEYLGLSSNDLTGAVPSRLGSLRNLQYLYLEQNDLTGGIPAELGGLSNLEALFLQGNRLSGEMPVELSELTNLRQLVLDGNLLTGEIPSELGDVASLEDLFLRDNRLTGEIPSELEELANLSKLYLEGNQLTGCIPSGLRGIERNDLRGLGLPYCTPPTP